MNDDLTTGNITIKLLRFAFPLMLGNVLQQLYNVVDTLIVGRFLGADALAAVGAAYTLMTFLTSILLGLCMGSSAYFAIQFESEKYCIFAVLFNFISNPQNQLMQIYEGFSRDFCCGAREHSELCC